MSSPEQQLPEVKFHPDSIETLPQELEGVVETVPSSPPPMPQVGDSGNMITSPQDPSQIPLQFVESRESLIKASKGDVGDSRTWYAKVLLRLARKALHFGRYVIYGEGNSTSKE